jgi:amino acid adenylation domain-containing protein
MSDKIPIELTPREYPLPVSFGQQRLWFFAQMFPEDPTYNEPLMVPMVGPVDTAALAQSLTEITRRHEAWRTVFTSADGQPMQEIRPPSPFPLTLLDLTSLPPEEREPEAKRFSVTDARRPFDLREGPLVRALLIRLTDTDSRLIVTAHHIIMDGVSYWHIFLPELQALYEAFSRGQPSPLPDLPYQYADFAAWQRRWLTEEELYPKLAYWRAHLADLTELCLPTDQPYPSRPSTRGASVPITLPAELMRRLRELGRRAGVSLFTTLLSAWKTLLFRYTGQGDIVVGSVASGRSRPEFDQVMGFFINNLVLRTRLDGTLRFIDLLARVSEVLRAAREHQDVPFDRLIAELTVPRSLNKHPIYNTMFNVIRLAPPSDPPTWSGDHFDTGTARVDLYLELFQGPSRLAGTIEYKQELYCPETIERMVGHFQMLLEGIVRDPEQRLSELPLLTPPEERQLSVWQGPVAPPLPDSEIPSLEQLFEAQAARSPEAIAVAHGGQQLTYEELNARVNQLAHYLRSQGVGPDTLVGLCMERSFDAVVGVLGVLKAGGAYVPLDPAYPSERLRFILEDADIKLLLTNKKHAGTVEQHRGPTVLLDEDWASIGQYGTDNPASLAAAGHLAYVIYTSGSTGRPKGVLVERKGLYHLAKAQERMFGLGVGSRVLHFFSLNFDGSVWDFTITWPVGGTLVLADQAAMLPGSNLAALLRAKDIHVVMLPPSALMMTPYQELPALHTLIAAGEALPEELVRRWAPGRRFFNAYGPTETTVVSVIAECHAGEGKPPIGRPFEFVEVDILDSAMRPVPVGVPGELYIGGPGVARGYLNRPDLTADRFIDNPSRERAGTRLYKTGDRVKWRPDGSIDYLERVDRQIKLRGFRIELGEIESTLQQHPSVQQARVEIQEHTGNDQRLVAYLVADASAKEGGPRGERSDWLLGEARSFARTKLPLYMVPAAFVLLDELPLLPSGKVDSKALSRRAPLAAMGGAESRSVTEARGDGKLSRVRPGRMSVEQTVVAIWRDILGVDGIKVDDAFFDVGGHSLSLARVQAKLLERLSVDIDIITLMRLSTIRQLTEHINGLGQRVPTPAEQPEGAESARAAPSFGALGAPSQEHPQALAIVGMAIRAPGARGPDELWEVIQTGRETIRALDPEALIARGAEPARVRAPEFVPAEGVLSDADQFDAAFFGYSDADAALMDPQQRLFLECAREALEHAGCDAARFQGRIGVFGGTGAPLHWLGPVANSLRGVGGGELESYRARTLNAPDFLAPRVAFKLGLRGPAVTLQTACSTSLAAVHLARHSLLAGECDLALAGGVSLSSLTEADQGYLRAEGGIGSVDGHCRPFDADASGMVKSSGVAIVALKRLSSALADGDTIHAVVRGSAMNNDGADKIGFTAPSEDGLAQVIQQAYEASFVDPGSVQFVEAHGTGTRIGDPTEVRALTRAFRRWTEQCGFCALGSLKANLGHLDAAAGAAGLIKATLSLAHEVIPKVAGFRTPNPLLDLPSTPFFVSDTSLPWPRTRSPRRAGVTAMGLGGTNVHVVLEEGPPVETGPSARPFQLLCLSGRTEAALAEIAQRLGAHLTSHPSLEIADVAHTLAVGRAQQGCRATIVCRDLSEARGALAPEGTPALLAPTRSASGARPVVFLFPGHGVQYMKMGLDVYEAEPVYRSEIDRCVEILRDAEHLDIEPLLLGQTPEVEGRLDEMKWAQPLLFTVEYALARQLMAWGVRPAAMLGHSVGEYVAAVIAGVLSLEDALALVATRGRLMDTTPPGSMLTVFIDPRALTPYLDDGVAIATYAPGSIVLSGSVDAIAAARRRLDRDGIETSGVRVSRASHSPLMHAIRDPFRQRVAAVQLRAPAVPVVSNVTGKYLTAEQATSPDAWVDHLCSAVRLTEGLGTLLEQKEPILLEIGPGSTLGSFLKAHPRYEPEASDIVGTLPSFRQRDEPSFAALLRAIGRVWELGVEVDWQSYYAHERRRRIPLPTYPFEGRRYTLGASPADDPSPREARVIEIARDRGVRGVDDYPGLRPRLEALCASLVLDFIARRLADQAGRAHSLEALRKAAGILPKFMPMLERLAQILVRSGLAQQDPTGEILLRREQAEGSSDRSARLRQDYPAFIGLVRFVEHCVSRYDEALTGVVEPIGVLYPDGTDAFYRACMSETAPYLYSDVYIDLACEAVLEIVRRREGQKTRILEVGAGHGMLTWPLAERLRGADVEYRFTDVGRSFLVRAATEAERRGLPWLKASRFDLNRPPAEQGIRDRYDIIVGFNAVHVALNLPAALENLHDLLAPAGSLVAVEVTRMDIWDELTWGLAPGYLDISRARGGLSMDLSRWEDLLARARFAHVEVVPQGAKRRAVEDHGLLIAERALADEADEADEEIERTLDVMPQEGPISIRLPPMSIRGRDIAPASAAGETEEIVRRSWRRLLGVPRVPAGANFFDLGGDSLLAVQLLAELRVKTGTELKMRQFAAQPTVEGIVALLRPPAESAPPPNSPAPKPFVRAPELLVPNDSGSGPLSVRSERLAQVQISHPRSDAAPTSSGPESGRRPPSFRLPREPVPTPISVRSERLTPVPISHSRSDAAPISSAPEGVRRPPSFRLPREPVPTPISMRPVKADNAPVEGPRAEAARTSSAADDCLLPLRSSGTKRPFFCVHPIGGGALCYEPLVKALDPERPFFGIQARMLEDIEARPSSVEEMAAHYVDAVQRAQPKGPYLLGGWSFGGVVAIEMARQLKRDGKAVDQLVLLDVTLSPGAGLELLRRVDSRLSTLAMLPSIFAGPSGRAKGGGRPPKSDLSRLASTLAVAAQNLAVYEHHLALWHSYAPAALDVPATHFVAEEQPLVGALLRSAGARELPIQGVSTLRVSGDHFSMISGDSVQSLAKRISATLDAAERQEPIGSVARGRRSVEEDEASVRAFLNEFVNRMLALDGATLAEKLWAQGADCVLVAVGDDDAIVGSGPVSERYARAHAAIRESRARLYDQRVLILAEGQTACAMAKLDSDVFSKDGRRSSYRGVRVSWVLERQGDGWRVVHAHYSLPLGGPGQTLG